MEKFVFPEINIVIPMAGAGSRFATAGFKDPKPLIPVNGKPMIQVVIDNVRIPNAKFIYIVQKSHDEKYGLKDFLSKITPNCAIIGINGITEGAACTVLLAKDYIDNDKPLLIANSDQFLEWDAEKFISSFLIEEKCDGGISTFIKENDPKWSYAKLDSDGFVTEVQEKVPISNLATTGIYFWRRGREYVKYAQQMIAKNIRVNNEFYVCPVYNEAIADKLKFRVSNCEKMWGLGVPDDLEYFLKNFTSK
jgi:dTDP-glucose pyrophosphorylase